MPGRLPQQLSSEGCRPQQSVSPFYGYTIDMSLYLGASGPLIEQRLLVVRGLLSKKGCLTTVSRACRGTEATVIPGHDYELGHDGRRPKTARSSVVGGGGATS